MIGQTISHYTILDKLGEGGMGVVYKAEDTRLKRIVALKFLPRHLSSTEAEQARFQQEAQAAATLNHTNICTIHAIEEYEDGQFIAMEFVDGVTLREKLPFKNINDALSCAMQIGEALQEAHAKGIVHRDVKAENVMINSRNQIKVMDFGLAKLRGSLKLTKTSSTAGTLAYMAPEQIQGADVDARSDIFSFGVLLFEMLTGKLPFRGEHEAAMMYSIVNEEAESLLKLRPDGPPELERIIGRSLEKDPADRYQHIDDMVSELRRIHKQSSRVSRAALPEMQTRSAEQPAKAEPASKATSSRKMVFVAGGFLALILAGILSYFMFRSEPSVDSLAVLPFVNASGDPATEYLSDGMTESIINSLTRIPQLRVVPRSTVFRFKGKDIDPQEVGQSLNVSSVLTGRVVQRGDELNVQLDLIDVRRQSQVWGEQYRRRTDDVISLQEEIVSAVSERLQVALTGETREKLAKRATENPEAYRAYLQGRYFWQKRREAEIRKAVEYFNQAIALDPTFALAYAGLADCYVLLEQYAGEPWRNIAPLATHAAEKALELDKSLGEARTTLAFIKSVEWDWTGAEREFRTAIEMNPNYPTVYHWYGLLLSHQGRWAESFDIIQKAEKLDPLSPVILLNVALAFDRCKDDMQTANQYFRKTLDLDAGFAPAYHRMGMMQVRRGMLDEGLVNIQKSVELSSRASENLSSLGYCLGKMGRTKEAREVLAELEHRYSQNKTSAYNIARVHAGLKDKEMMFKWLQRDYEAHSGWMSWLGYDFEWDEYRGDPRFMVLMKNIGLAK